MQDSTRTEAQRKLDERRAALKKLGLMAAYTAPVLIATSVPTKSARASGGAPNSGPPSNFVPV